MRELKEQIAYQGYEINTKRPAQPRPAPHNRPEAQKTPAETNVRPVSEIKRPEPKPVAMSAHTYRRRVVRTLAPVEEPSTWATLAERRERLRRAYARPETHHPLVPRTLAQTGMPAPRGRVQPMRRMQLQQSASRIPIRSGRRRRGFFARMLAMLAVLAICAFGVNFALTSSTFHVQQVHIAGTQNPAIIDGIEHMGVQGQNIFLVDTAALAARIDALPPVASANLEKQWPDQLLVTIVERVPALLWKTQYGTYSVDRQAVVIAPAADTAGAGQLMTVVDMRSQQIGEHAQPIRPGVRLNQADVTFALHVFAAVPQTIGLSDFTLQYTSGPAGVTSAGGNGVYILESPTGWVAYLGSASDTNPLENRLAELQSILAMAQKQQLNLATIDLRFGLRPVYTLKHS